MDEQKYIAFYKPCGVLTAFTSDEGQETLKSYIDVPDVYPAGRLDMDSEGLLFLTNDGDLAHRLTDPKFNHPKTYLVQVEGVPAPDALSKLESGVEVKGEKTRRAQVVVVPEPALPPRSKPVTPHGPTSWLRLVLREGRKRQIRHMTAVVGLPTLRLVRLAVGPVALGDLKPGEWRYLTTTEIEALKALLKNPVVDHTEKEPPKRGPLMRTRTPERAKRKAPAHGSKSRPPRRRTRY